MGDKELLEWLLDALEIDRKIARRLAAGELVLYFYEDGVGVCPPYTPGPSDFRLTGVVPPTWEHALTEALEADVTAFIRRQQDGEYGKTVTFEVIGR